MAFLVSLADVRDVVVIIYGILGAMVFCAVLILVLALIYAVNALKRLVRDLVNDSVKPTLGSIKDSAENIKGTTEFVGQTAVSPIIRVYSTAAGVRRGLGVLSGLSRFRRGA
jgi:hypothetical protein